MDSQSSSAHVAQIRCPLLPNVPGKLSHSRKMNVASATNMAGQNHSQLVSKWKNYDKHLFVSFKSLAVESSWLDEGYLDPLALREEDP